MSLIGREAELQRLDDLINQARQGLSGVLVVRGEAGIGKTALLAAAAVPDDFQCVRLTGIESEMRLGHAALHQLLTPYLDQLATLPAPQARALTAAFGMEDEGVPDPFLVGLGTLTLVSSAATRRGLLVYVDDAQWLDGESADALGFLARRLYADRVCLFFSVRDGTEERPSLERLPSLRLTRLDEESSEQLLDVAVGPMAPAVRTQLLSEAEGNPLALVELGRGLSEAQLSGAASIPAPLTVDGRLEQHFLRQVTGLPMPTQALLLVAAAEPVGEARTVWRAGEILGFSERALAPAQDAGLLASTSDITFRHPLIRSAVYRGATHADRQAAHAALATASAAGGDATRAAWHRGVATLAPDEAVAADLESAALRMGGMGSLSAAAALLARSAELTPNPATRARRLLQSAGAELGVGSTARARARLDEAAPHLTDPALVAQARQIRAGMAYIDAFPGARPPASGSGLVAETVARMLEAVRALEQLDVRLAREALLDAIPMAVYFQASGEASPQAVARVALATRLPPSAVETTADLMLDATASLVADGYASSGKALHAARAALQLDADLWTNPRYLTRACWIAFALGDVDLLQRLIETCLRITREQGAYQGIAEALDYHFHFQLLMGRLGDVHDTLVELTATHEVFGRYSGTARTGDLLVAAWRGDEHVVRTGVEELVNDASELGYLMIRCEYALLLVELGLGNYEAAAKVALARDNWITDLSVVALRAADTIEACVRSATPDAGAAAWELLASRAATSESPLDVGLAARARALLESDEAAEPHYRHSIEMLERTGADLHAARSRLLFGEWLRRQKRRREAREQLSSALNTFDGSGARGFADRARIELLATGGQARRRVDETRFDLTPQEAQIARLAAEGLTNPEIATRLFLSASTVDYHLRKVYRKLGIRSRHEIAGSLTND